MKKFIKTYRKQKLRASTIVEVIVALIICMIVFTISMTIVLKSQKNNNISSKQKAQLILSNFSRKNLDIISNSESDQLKVSINSTKIDTLQDTQKIIVSIVDNMGKTVGSKTIWMKSAEQ